MKAISNADQAASRDRARVLKRSGNLKIGRRAILGGIAAAPFAAASGARASAQQKPAAPATELALRMTVTLAEESQELGDSPYGHRRRIVVTGGHFEGPRIHGKVLDGADWQLRRSDGFTWLEAEAMLQADDGALIHLRDRGLMNLYQPGAKEIYWRTAADFEAPQGPHDWLNRSLFIGAYDSYDSTANVFTIAFYRLI